MKKIILYIALLGSACAAWAQDTVKTHLTISGYAELYYGYDFNKPADHNRPSFIYSHNRHNEVNLNLGFIKANYDDGNVRASLALMAGTYTNANLAAEPGVLKNVFEANAGIKLAKQTNLWLDAGIFASHIGFESAISKDCWVLTRNISSENTPYYESGVKITYATNDGKLTLAGLYLNGWQRIQRQDGNNQPAGGLQITYKPSAAVTLNYSNYLGPEGADSIRLRRIYHDFYGIFQLNQNLGLTFGFDYGLQQKARAGSVYNHIISPVAIARYQFNSKWAAAGRFEYYEDRNGIFIVTTQPQGFKTRGYSLNIDYAPVSHALIRLEGKMYDSQQDVFLKNGLAVNTYPMLTASFALSF